MNFDFNVDTARMVRLSIMRLGLIFNGATIKALGSPKKINIGLDAKNKALGIKASDGNPDIKEFDFAKKSNEKWIRVNSVQLVRAIERVTGLKFDNTTKPFNARFDKKLNMLIVDLNEKVVEE